MFMLWYLQHFRIRASHGICGVHLSTNLHLLLCWLVCGMEAATSLSGVQWCPLKLYRFHHNLDVVLNLCIISFNRIATLCFSNKHLLICIYVATVCITNSINIIIYKVDSATFKENGNQKPKTSPKTNQFMNLRLMFYSLLGSVVGIISVPANFYFFSSSIPISTWN